MKRRALAMVSLLVSVASLVGIEGCSAAGPEGGTPKGGEEAQKKGTAEGTGSGSGTAGGGAAIDSCGFVTTFRRACRGDSFVRTSSRPVGCVEHETSCQGLAPRSTERETSDCYENSNSTGVAFKGRCSDWDAYWKGQRECLKDDHCAPGGACVSFACICDGAPCPKPGAPGDPGTGSGSGSGSRTGTGSGSGSGTGSDGGSSGPPAPDAGRAGPPGPPPP